jgi:molybdopterin synthase sulfur carrier subunit
MSVMIRIPSPLRRVTNGLDKVEVNGETLQGCINELESEFPGVSERMLDEQGALREFVNVYINGEDVRFLQGLETTTQSGDEISIVPAVAGGCR